MGQLIGHKSPFDGHPCTRRGDRIAVKFQHPFEPLTLWAIHERFEGTNGDWQHVDTVDKFTPKKGSNWTVLEGEWVEETLPGSKIKLRHWLVPDAV